MRMKKFTLLMVLVAAVLFAIPAQAFLWNWSEQTPQFKSKSGLVNTDNVRQPLWKFTGRELSNFRCFDGQSPVQAGRRAATKDEHGIITDPDEGVTKYYKRAGTGYYASNGFVYNEDQSGIVTIVECEDAGTVYIKDPVSHYAQGTWVKGTKDGNTITVAGAQPLAWNSSYSATLSLNWGNVQTTQNGNTYLRGEGDITFTVDDEAGTITLDGSSADKIIAVFWDDDNSWSGWGDYGTVWTVDPNYQPASTDLIVLPDGAEVQQWYAEGAGLTDVPTDVKVAFVGNEVYISGLTSNFPTAWIKGTLEGTTVTFSGLQFVGMYNSTMPIWAVGADSQTGALQDFTMTYDSEAKTLTLDEGQILVFNAADDKMYYLSYIQSLTIYAEEPAPAVIDELPYYNSFDDAASRKHFTIIDANEDGRTWSWYNGMVRYTYHQTNQGDDWLISPQIYLQAGKTYIFNILAHAQSSTYPERIEVKVAKVPESDNNAPTAALMAAGNEVIAPSDVTTTGFVPFTNDAFTVAETGYYYIGVHAISNADSYYLYVDDFEVKLKEPEDIEISPESGANISEALAAAEEGKNVKNITINLAEGGNYTITGPLTAYANFEIQGNGATIDASGLSNNFIQMAATSDPSVVVPVEYVSIHNATIKGLKKALFYSTQKGYLLNWLTIDNSVIELAADATTIDFTKGSAARSFNIENSTIYAPTATTKSFYSSQSGQKLTELDAEGIQTFIVKNSTMYNLAPGKNFFTHRQNSQKWEKYVAKNNIFVNCGKSGQVIKGMNGGGSSTNPVWDIDGNVFNFEAEGVMTDTSAAEETGDTTEGEGVQNSLAGIVTFTDAAAGDFNGTFAAAPVEEPVEESASRRDAEKATLLNCGDPRWTIEWKQGYAINIDAKFGDVTTVPADYAAEGETVTITAKPNPADKFEFAGIKVEGVNSDLEVEVTPDEENPEKFTFTMPADAVIVSATFRRIAVDIIVNPEDIEAGDIAAALDAKIASYDYLDPLTEEIIPVRINNIYIYLAGGEEYTLTKTLTAPNSIIISGTTNANDELATIHVAEGVTDDFITLNGTETLAKKADGTEVADHKYITTVIINGVAIYDLKGAVVKDAQKTWLGSLAIYNSIIQVPDAQKNVIDFNGKGYVGHALVLNSTIYAEKQNTGFFAQYGSRPKNIDGNDTSLEQELYVQNSTFANIANGKNFCDLKQKGTAQNVYTIKNCIFADCGKQNQVVVGFNGGQSSATPKWDVDGNVFNWGGLDTSAAETTKAGQKDGEDIVKNSLAGRVEFADIAEPDLGGRMILAPGVEAPESMPGDPRWTLTTAEGFNITVIVSKDGTGSASAEYTYAAEGDEVGLTTTPAEGYEIEAIVMTDADGKLLDSVDGDSFVMPGEDVIIIVTYTKTTGIDDVTTAESEEGAWFTIKGIRIDKPVQKGLYIHNGKKVVIK